MSDRFRCSCRRCTIRSLMGPAIIITIGLLFLLDQMRGDHFSFSSTWPIILLVIGGIQLATAMASTEGHIYGPLPPSPPGTVPPPPNPYSGQGQAQ